LPIMRVSINFNQIFNNSGIFRIFNCFQNLKNVNFCKFFIMFKICLAKPCGW